MRRIVACAIIGVATTSAQDREESPTGMSEKLRAKLMEDAVAFAAKPVREVKEPDESVIILDPFTVVESYRNRQLEAAIERDERRHKQEEFSIITGGTIYKAGPLEIGGWMDGNDWVFLRRRR
jgi:hypothetical protein